MQAERHRPHTCIVVAAPLTLKAFMLGHLKALAGIAEVTVVANFTPEDETFPWPADIARVAVPIARPIALWTDIVALLALTRLFRQQRFDLVHSLTPKAGLLAMLAAWLAGVPLRLHMFTGQVWVTRTGPMRALLKSADRLIGRLATHVLTDSASQREFLAGQASWRRANRRYSRMAHPAASTPRAFGRTRLYAIASGAVTAYPWTPSCFSTWAA